MALSGFVMGFADFRLALPIEEVASLLSTVIFGGIPFVVREKDYENAFPTFILQSAFLGIVAELSGAPDHYTIEIGTRPSASVEGVPDIADFSAMLKQQLEQIRGLIIIILNV